MFKYIASTIVIIILLFALSWAIAGNDFFLAKYFNPKQEALRRETFEQSKAYRQGNAQEVRAMQMEYIEASPEHKAALRSVIIHRTADMTDLPPDLQSFVISLRGQSELTR